VNHYSCDMGTPRQEVKTTSSGLPAIKILDTYRKSLSEEALRAETAQARLQTPTLLVTATMKRFHHESSESSRPIKEPKHYACPEGKAFIELNGRKHAISVLLDSGSNIFLINQDTARRLEIPTEARDSRLKITTFDGETAPTGGIFYTHPILLEIGAKSHRSMISCEIANAGRHDLIIPFWCWHNEHPLKNITDPTKWAFEETRCHAH